MTDAFDELESQLRRGVRALGRPGFSPVRHGRKRTLALALAAVLAVSAGALAATRISGGLSAETQGREIALQAVRDTAHLSLCAPIAGNDPPSQHPALSNSTPLREITALLPALATAEPSADRARTLALLPRFAPSTGALLTRTLRTISLQEGVQLVVFVQQGAGLEALSDPVGCGQARLVRALLLSRHRPVAVQHWARWRLAQMRDTVPGVQTLYVFERTPHQLGGGGGADSVEPGHPLHAGLRVVAGNAGGSRLFVGVARAHTTQILIKNRSAAMRRHRARFPVVQRFYAVLVPKDTGPFRLLEVAADGSVVGSIDLRQ